MKEREKATGRENGAKAERRLRGEEHGGGPCEVPGEESSLRRKKGREFFFLQNKGAQMRDSPKLMLQLTAIFLRRLINRRNITWRIKKKPIK